VVWVVGALFSWTVWCFGSWSEKIIYTYNLFYFTFFPGCKGYKIQYRNASEKEKDAAADQTTPLSTLRSGGSE
jgi:hypothetical protein